MAITWKPKERPKLTKYTDEVKAEIKRQLHYIPNQTQIAENVRTKFNIDKTSDAVRAQVKQIAKDNPDIICEKSLSGYTKEIEEFTIAKLENESMSNESIAKQIVKKFGLDKNINTVTSYVRNLKQQKKLKAKQRPIRRLFFDIETSYYTARVWGIRKQYINPAQIITDSKIICVSYKWQFEDQVHTIRWNQETQDDTQLLKEFIKILGEADEIVAHNGDNFDIKVLRTRAIATGNLMFPTYRTMDTLKKARQYFRFASNKLDYIGEYLNTGRKKDTGGLALWIDIVENKSEESLQKMVDYCEQDVILMEDTYHVISPFILHNNNFAVLTGGHKWECPECASEDVEMYRTYTTAMGVVRRNMKCNCCKKQYRISNLTYFNMLSHLHRKNQTL